MEGPRDKTNSYLLSTDNVQGTVRGTESRGCRKERCYFILREFGTDLRKWPNAQENSGKRLEKWSYFALILKVRTDTEGQVGIWRNPDFDLGSPVWHWGGQRTPLFLSLSLPCATVMLTISYPSHPLGYLYLLLFCFFLLFEISLSSLFFLVLLRSLFIVALIFSRIFAESLSSDLNFFLKMQSVIPNSYEIFLHGSSVILPTPTLSLLSLAAFPKSSGSPPVWKCGLWKLIFMSSHAD